MSAALADEESRGDGEALSTEFCTLRLSFVVIFGFFAEFDLCS
jgi:hypothetical protein